MTVGRRNDGEMAGLELVLRVAEESLVILMWCMSMGLYFVDSSI